MFGKVKKNKIQANFKAKKFWTHLWELLRPIQPDVKILGFLMVVVEIIKLAGPYLLKLIIDTLTNFQTERIFNIFGLVAAIFIVYEILSAFSFIVDRKIISALVKAESNLIITAFSKMIFLHLGFHEKENTGNKVSKIDRGVSKIDELLSMVFWDVGPTIIQIILTIATLFFVDWRFGVIVCIFMPLFVAITLKVNRRNYPLRRERYDSMERSSGQMTQAIININTLKSFVQEEREISALKKITDKTYGLILSELGAIIKINLARNFIIDAGRALILCVGIYLVWEGSITVGSLVFVYTISEKALLSLFRITRLYDKIMESSEAVERLHVLSEEKNLVKNPKNGIKPKNVHGGIEFEDVSFVYDNSQDTALEKVRTKILAGSTTALVGPSGGGKTTFVRMLFRHYDPSEGRVLLDGKDLRDYDLFAFRKFFAIVPQEVEVFGMSVRDNISYAKPDASFAEIQAAARIANAEEFIEKLVSGYDTLVGERGIRLSGGQRQRVGIARAILANPKVLIFDEATSSLDSYSEKLIQDAMEKIKKNRTVILIAHRLSTISKADKIIVLENGRVVEEGNHAELAAKDGGLYKKLISLQNIGEVD